MSRSVQLLGRPQVHGAPGGYQVRSRKSWALLAYLLLSERPPTRTQLASLLYEHADDPLGALRWGLAEVRRVLGGDAFVEGDPVVLRLPPGTVVDVDVVTRGTWSEAVALPGLGAGLLSGLAVRDAATFDSWLLSEQHRVDAASEEILHEAALGSMSRGALTEAIGYAVRLLAMTPLEENNHALLIRLYRMAGDTAAAELQLATCTELLERELGVRPGAVVRAAIRERVPEPGGPVDLPTVRATLESGQAAVSAGAIETGADTRRPAVRMADRAGDAALRVSARLVLAEALIHSLRGLDEEGLATLQAADDIALAGGDRVAAAGARAELGYVDFLRGRGDRARLWLSEAIELAGGEPSITAKATTYLGSVCSDQGRYATARSLLEDGIRLSRATGDCRRSAYGRSMLGRLHLLRGDLDAAAHELGAALDAATTDHWFSFVPWPQALLGEVELARGDLAAAERLLEQAFARACQLGDPCWEGLAARGIALTAAARGDRTTAFEVLADARTRASRTADPYVWLDGYILDAQCTLGLRLGHPQTAGWVEALQELASRTGMRELRVRGLLHGAALGRPGDAAAARLLGDDLENDQLRTLLAEGLDHSPEQRFN